MPYGRKCIDLYRVNTILLEQYKCRFTRDKSKINLGLSSGMLLSLDSNELDPLDTALIELSTRT